MKISKLTKDTYEETYRDGYDKTYPSIELVRIENIFFKKKGHLLDFGCGPGSNGIHFLKKGFKVTFCDISTKALSNVKKKIYYLGSKYKNKYELINLYKNPNYFEKKKNYFDFIICMSVFNNFESEKMAKKYLKKFCYLLKKRGKLVIDSNLANDHNYKKVKLNNELYYTTNPNNDHLLKMFFPSTIYKFSKLVKNSGFKINDIGKSNFKIFSTFENEIIISATKI
tara:strand:- start:1598 stop:2275 length:678 start_codon:yes stop_codon:yes gene_type:complete